MTGACEAEQPVRRDAETDRDQEDLAERIAEHRLERLVEAEINPVFVLPEGQGVRAADGVAVLAAA